MKYYPLLVFCFLLQTLVAQNNGDCPQATYLKLSKDSTSFSIKTPPKGYGKAMEITAPAKDPYFFRKEHNTAWYKFRSPFSGIISLEISPFDASNDYDFLLFTDTTGNFCEKLIQNKPIPMRSVISRNDTSIASKTGLSAYSGELFIKEGPGNSYGESIKVKKGQRFYLVLDNVYGGGKGHQIDFHYYYPAQIRGKVEELGTDSLIDASIQLIETEEGEILDSVILGLEDKGMFRINKPLEYGKKYMLLISKEGYFDQKISVKRSKTPLQIKLLPKRKNAKVVFEHINFHGNSDSFLPKAKEPLSELLKIMKDYPSLKIEVGGHVNAAGGLRVYNPNQNTRYLSLSKSRAYAVKKYLVENGILKTRIKTVGYGASRMLYPTTMDDIKMMKNRRVEIKILDF